jgi:hypothetical protein
VKRSAGKSSRKKIQYRIFFFFHLWISSDGHQCLGPVSFRSVTSSPDTNKKKNSTKIRNEWHTKKERGKRRGAVWEREEREHSCSHARKIANSNRLRFLLLSTFQNPIDESWRSRTRVLCVPMYMYRVFMLTQAWIALNMVVVVCAITSVYLCALLFCIFAQHQDGGIFPVNCPTININPMISPPTHLSIRFSESDIKRERGGL